MHRPKIKTALVITFAVIGMIFGVFAAFAINRIASINGNVEEIATNWMPSVDLAQTMALKVSQLRVAYRDHILAPDSASMAKFETVIKNTTTALEESIRVYTATMQPTKAETDALSSISASLADFNRAAPAVIEPSKLNKTEEATKALYGQLFPIGQKMTDETDKLIAINKEGAATAYEASKSAFFFSIVLSGIAIGVTVLVLMAAIWFAITGIARPIQTITLAMKALADGDTSSPIPYNGRADEIGDMAAAVGVFRENAVERVRLEQETEVSRSISEKEQIERERQKEKEAADVQFAVDHVANGLSKLSDGDVSYRIHQPFTPSLDTVRIDFNTSAEKLQIALINVAQNARGIDAGASEIKAAASDLAKRTEQQAAAVEETAAALEEITTTVQDSTRRAQEAGQLVSRAKAGAEHSGDVVRKAVTAMEQIANSANEISNIIGVIDEIAFQTNLLALNAGVEAARAGEAGKGFAVVAQEVRELAQRSARAAKEIKALITTSNNQVEAGVRLVGETGRALETIVTEVQEINQHVSAIVEAAQEQSSGLQQINTAVNHMDQDTQKNAAMVEQSTAASHNLAKEVRSLNDLLAQFKLSDGAYPASATSADFANDTGSAPSPARALGQRIVSAFAGNAAIDISKRDWAEF